MRARLDQLLVEKGFFESRERARRAVMAGMVTVDGVRVDKAGTSVSSTVELEVEGPQEPFVSRGGRKLDQALDHFEIDPTDWTCLDIGASTGGFTDCLLQRGARRVYALDVGRGQLDFKLRRDPRVVTMEGINARYLEPADIPEPCQLITVDVSFISLVKLVPALLPVLAPDGFLLTLIKPQFEVGKGLVGKGGVVRDESLRQRIIQERGEDLASLGVVLMGIVDSEVEGAKGNREALALFRKCQ
jgi:23S rRNA (cytidine1920-2'-O)/16S rRNA (cytidine1409-2'-O)-methyltransferase